MARVPRRAASLLDSVAVTHEFSRAQALELAERWLAVFAPDGYGQASRQYLWHIFSFGRTEALAGPAARAAYDAQACDAWLVLTNDRRTALRTGTRPEFEPFADALVFPENLAWTMAFTHEQGLGPYFARHPDHRRLDAEMQARMSKLRDAARARERGWTAD